MTLVKCLEDHTGKEDRRDEGGNQTDDKRRSKSSDRTCTEVEEYYPSDDRSEVRVEDSTEGIAIPIGDGTSHTLTVAELFLDTLIDKYVSIHRHT